MTELYINNQLVDLPTDFKVTLVTENLYFSSASTYTFDVKLPMAPCSNNARIFANINRLDKSVTAQSLPARLIVDNRVILNGTAAIVGITDESVSVQLLQGRSEQNWKAKYDKTYIDELAMGDISEWGLKWENGHAAMDGSKVQPTEVGTSSTVNHGFYWSQKNYSDYTNGDVVLTPVENQDTGEIMNPIGSADEFTTKLNFCLRDPNTPYPTGHPYYILPERLAPQPKLRVMVRKVFAALDLELYQNELEGIEMYNNLILANSTEVQYIADVLPHITFIEFVELLQNLFNCVVEINGTRTRIYLRKNLYTLQGGDWAEKIGKIVDEFETDIDTEPSVSDADKAKVYDIAYPDYGTLFLGNDFKDVPIITDPTKLTNQDNPYVFGRDPVSGIKYSSPFANSNHIFGREIDRWEPSNDLDESVTLKLVPLMPSENYVIDPHHYFSIQDSSFVITGHTYADIVINIPTAVGRNTQNYGQNIQELLDDLETPEGRLTIDKVCLGFLSKNFAFDEPPTLGTHNSTYYILTPQYKAKLEDQLNPGQWIIDSEQVYDMNLRRRLRQGEVLRNFYNEFYKDTPVVKVSDSTSIKFVTNGRMYKVLDNFLIHNQLFACQQIKYTIDAKGFQPIAEGTFYKL